MKDWQEAGTILADALAKTDATPGGGAAAGAAGQMGCALAQMAVGISAQAKKIDAERRAALKRAHADFGGMRADFARLTEDDAAAFDAVMAVYGLKKEDPVRAQKMQSALQQAADVPLATAQAAVEALAAVGAAKPATVGTVASDMNCAEHLLRAAGLSALENVEINAACMKDGGAAAELRRRAGELRRQLSA